MCTRIRVSQLTSFSAAFFPSYRYGTYMRKEGCPSDGELGTETSLESQTKEVGIQQHGSHEFRLRPADHSGTRPRPHEAQNRWEGPHLVGPGDSASRVAYTSAASGPATASWQPGPPAKPGRMAKGGSPPETGQQPIILLKTAKRKLLYFLGMQRRKTMHKKARE